MQPEPGSDQTLSSPSSSRPLFVAFDIETTGRRLRKDTMFAVGWAAGFGSEEYISEGCLILDLRKPSSVEWKDFWTKKGWEEKCFDTFWVKHTDVLDDLQDHSKTNEARIVCGHPADMAHLLNSKLQKLEKQNPNGNVYIVSDTMSFDTVWLCHFMEKHGFPGLDKNRNGKYSGKAVHTGSFRYGAYETVPGCLDRPWDQDQSYLDTVFPVHDHNPANDAKQILSIFFACKNHIENQNKNVA